MKKINPEEFAREMQKIVDDGDPEMAHIDADALICRALEERGFRVGIEIFRKMTKWYA